MTDIPGALANMARNAEERAARLEDALDEAKAEIRNLSRQLSSANTRLAAMREAVKTLIVAFESGGEKK